MQITIPPASKELFKNGICHPDLYLWDSWSYVEDDVMHLYCLAVARKKDDGSILRPADRNDYPFHFRHFSSKDEGETWKDEGCFLKPRTNLKTFDSRTVWSGSIELLKDGNKLVAYTGIDIIDPEHNFLQHIGLALSQDGYTINKIVDEPLSSPSRDWEGIKSKGYYLDLPENLGSNMGEEGGPILAWRDPFIIQENNEIYLFWAAKVGPLKNAIAWAKLKPSGDLYEIEELQNPITLPDGEKFTQLELPKIYFDEHKKRYILFVSTCNRTYEGQPDDEVDKCMRVYSSKNISGPWESMGDKILGKENLFGPTVLRTDFKNERLLCISPYSDAAENNLNLTFSKPFYVYLNPLRIEFL